MVTNGKFLFQEETEGETSMSIPMKHGKGTCKNAELKRRFI